MDEELSKSDRRIMKKSLKKFSAFDLMIIAMMASLGLAIKPIIVPLVHMITGPLFIPGGSIAGGFYMLWIVLGMGLVKKRGTCTLIAFVQAIITITLGTVGSHGILSVLTYTLPGIVAEVPFLFGKNKEYHVLHFMCGCILSNLAGTYGINLIFFQLPWIPLLLSLSSAALSGAIGGVVAYMLHTKIKVIL